MKKAPNPILVVALLVSILVHLLLVDRAIELTLKWQLFGTSVADEFFRIQDRDITSLPEIRPGRTHWRPEEIISVGPTKEEVLVNQEKRDTKLLVESEKFISSDASEQELQSLLETIEKAIEAEQIPREQEPITTPAAEPTIPQEVLAIEKKGIPPPGRIWISSKVKRGTATSDFVFLSDAGAFTEPPPSGITPQPGSNVPTSTSPSERLSMARTAMADDTKTIPGVIITPPPLTEEIVESADLVDIVSDEYEKIRKYPPLDDILTVQLFTYHRPGESRGYFKLVVEPRKDRRDINVIPKDIVFAVDSSKSITQKTLTQYVQGLNLCLAATDPRDRFNLVEFKDFIRKLSDEDVIPATPQALARAQAMLSDLVSEGGTDVYKSLTQLVTYQPHPGRPRIIFLISDGRPTTGIRQNRDIINEVTELNNLRTSVFTFAGGEEINTSLLDLLSYRNRGARMFETDDRRIPQSLLEFYQEFSSPILLNPRFNFGSIGSEDVYPKVLPDLYLRGSLEIFGTFDREDEFSMQLLGEADGQTKEYVLQRKLTGPDNGDESIARAWAFRKIYYLVGQMVQKGGSEAVLSTIERLSHDYRVETSYHPVKGGRL